MRTSAAYRTFARMGRHLLNIGSNISAIFAFSTHPTRLMLPYHLTHHSPSASGWLFSLLSLTLGTVVGADWIFPSHRGRRELGLSSHLPIPFVSQRTKEEKRRETTYSPGRHCGKQNVPRKQHGGGSSMVLFVSDESGVRIDELAVFFSSSRSLDMIDDGGENAYIDSRSFIPKPSFCFLWKHSLLCPLHQGRFFPEGRPETRRGGTWKRGRGWRLGHCT